MTKSTITRERLEWLSQISCRDDIEDIGGDEIHELARMALAAMDSEAKEPISFDEWSRKCALQITICYPDFREKAQYIWDSARATQHATPKEVTAEDCPAFVKYDTTEVDEAWARGFNSCRAAMLIGGRS